MLSKFAKSFSPSFITIKDEITFTKQFRSALQKRLNHKNHDEFLRLEISSGQGCQGFAYKFKFDNILKEDDYVLQENERIAFALNSEEMKLIRGSTIDHISEMMKEVFYVKENPNAELSCSCKTSFSPKQHIV